MFCGARTPKPYGHRTDTTEQQLPAPDELTRVATLAAPFHTLACWSPPLRRRVYITRRAGRLVFTDSYESTSRSPRSQLRVPCAFLSAGGGATRRTTCCRRSGLNGFAIQTTAPS